MKAFTPVIVVFIMLIIGAAFFITRNNDNSSQESSESRQIEQEQKTETASTILIIGDANAPATVVEYFDYKCPSCNNFHYSTAQEIGESYIDTDQAKFEIRITPIIGPDSANAGRGAYCANEQGLFSEYHDSVLSFMKDNYYEAGNFAAEFENILTTSKLSEIVTPIGINTQQFISCVDSDLYNTNLDNNLLAAAEDEIRGTPGFAIGDQSFVGGQPFSVFKTLLDIELR